MKKFTGLLFIALILFGCTEKINVRLDPNYTRLVVDGAISNDTAAFTIRLTQTADYFYNAPIPVVTNAILTITDGTTTLPLTETQPGISGIYKTDPAFHGSIGKEYTLNVTLPAPIAGKSNYSATCRMVSVTRLDQIEVSDTSFENGTRDFWVVKMYAHEPAAEQNYYMFHLYRNDTLMTDSISKVVISDDQLVNGMNFSGYPVIFINKKNGWEKIRPGDKMKLQMSGITKEYYNFISEVQLAGFNIPFFMGPPANVVGNIDNDAVGFFAAYSNSYATTIVK